MMLHATVPTANAAEGMPRRRFTVADVEAMVAAGILDEDERVELIGGELVPMSAKGNHHEVMKAALLDRWIRCRTEDVRLIPVTTFRLSLDTYLEPDVVIYPRASGLKNLSADNVLLVVEIADTSLRYDVGRKAVLYAGFGVRELWVIDALRMALRIFRQPGADGYAEQRDLERDADALAAFAPAAFTSVSPTWTSGRPGRPTPLP